MWHMERENLGRLSGVCFLPNCVTMLMGRLLLFFPRALCISLNQHQEQRTLANNKSNRNQNRFFLAVTIVWHHFRFRSPIFNGLDQIFYLGLFLFSSMLFYLSPPPHQLQCKPVRMDRVVSRIRAATPKFSSLILYREKATRLDKRTSGKNEQRLETKNFMRRRTILLGQLFWNKSFSRWAKKVCIVFSYWKMHLDIEINDSIFRSFVRFGLVDGWVRNVSLLSYLLILFA